MPELAYQRLPFDEAIEYLRQRGRVQLPTKAWTDIKGGMHSRAFVVAGAMKSALLSDLYTAVDDALSQGGAITQFRRDFDQFVKRHGWNYKGKRGWRTATIYNTNLRTAYSAGHYKQMTTPAMLKARPYWRYIGGLSAEPREEHLAWNGTVLRADDPWWVDHYPPNGWGCKCKVVSHSKRELDRDGRKVGKAPEGETYEWTNPKTGEVINVPKGLDPGWDYNPGQTAWGRSEAQRLMEDQGPWVDIDPWRPAAYNRPDKIVVDIPRAALGEEATTVKGLRQALRDAIGDDEVGFVDPTGETTIISQAITDHILQNKKRWDGREAYFSFIPELIEDPYEVWISFARSEVSGRVGIRKKYVKALQLDKKRVIGLYAETMNGHWVSGDLFRGGLTGAGNLRKGRLLFGRE